VLSFVRFITIIAVATAVVMYIITVVKVRRHRAWWSAFWLGLNPMAASQGANPIKSFIEVFIVIIVANVPQGLPATVTSCLTVCAQVHARDGYPEAYARMRRESL
jgi:magnesium-transporting ATPase (P-type)